MNHLYKTLEYVSCCIANEESSSSFMLFIFSLSEFVYIVAETRNMSQFARIVACLDFLHEDGLPHMPPQ